MPGASAPPQPLSAVRGARAAMRDSYAGKGTAALVAADTGQAWDVQSAASLPSADGVLSIIGGKLTHSANTGTSNATGRADVPLAGNVTRIGMDFVLVDGSTDNGIIMLIVWQNPVGNGPVPNSPCHFGVSKTHWSYTLYDAVAGDGPLPASGNATGALALLADGVTVHRAEIFLDYAKASALIVITDGVTGRPVVVQRVSDSRIATWAGPNAGLEIYRNTPATDVRGAYLNVWADDQVPDRNLRFPTRDEAIEPVRSEVDAARPVVVDYSASPANNIAIPTGAFGTLDATNLKITFKAPPSGRVLVTLQGFLGTAAAGQVWWSLEDPTNNPGVDYAASEVRESIAYAVTTLDCLLTNLIPGKAYTYRWRGVTAAAAGNQFLFCDSSALRSALMKATPVA